MSDLIDRIVAARRTGATCGGVAPLDLDGGYALARAVWPRLGTAAGWKVGATSAGAQAFLKIEEPIRGCILAEGIHTTGDVIDVGARPAEAEPEILFHLDRDVAPGDDPLAAADRVAIGLEVVRPSRDDAFALGAGFIVADNAAHVAIVIGPDFDPALLDTPAAIGVTLRHNGAIAGEGDASAVLGDPRAALRWLATREHLRAGDWVASGAIMRACRFAPGDRVEADFGALGSVVALAR